MSTRWPERVKDAVREAHAAGLTPSEVLKKLHAGTLAGIDAPTLVPERTLFSWWEQAKRARQKAYAEAPTCPKCGQPAPGLAPPSKPEGGTLLERISRELEEKERKREADAEAELTLRSD